MINSLNLILLVTFFLTVLIDLTFAIEIGIVLSSLLFMKRMADAGLQAVFEVDSDVLENYSDLSKELGIYEISGPFFFAFCQAIPFNDQIDRNNFKSIDPKDETCTFYRFYRNA